MTHTNLWQFDGTEPLEIREKKAVNVFGITVGWAGPSNREENVVVCHRHRYDHDGEKMDYFRNEGGYCFGDRAITAMRQLGADRIAVIEVDTDTIYEFSLDQYDNSDLTSEKVAEIEDRGVHDGTNICVPTDDARYTWDRSECRIINDH
jgi:hypothetical protein